MIVAVENVYKFYDGIAAVSGLTLEIERGERIVILGPSGCGKTTLLRMIAGFVCPDKGRISIDGIMVARDGKSLVAPENRGIGMVFQDLALWPHLNVYGNLEFGLKAKRIPKNRRDDLINNFLEKVQMAKFKSSYPSELSGGQQQRIALARALVMQPKMLLMDEPLSNLDIELNLSLRKEILRLQNELGTTLLYVTHDRDEAFSLATRIVLMENGVIKKTGSAEEISMHLSNSKSKA